MRVKADAKAPEETVEVSGESAEVRGRGLWKREEFAESGKKSAKARRESRVAEAEDITMLREAANGEGAGYREGERHGRDVECRKEESGRNLTGPRRRRNCREVAMPRKGKGRRYCEGAKWQRHDGVAKTVKFLRDGRVVCFNVFDTLPARWSL